MIPHGATVSGAANEATVSRTAVFGDAVCICALFHRWSHHLELTLKPKLLHMIAVSELLLELLLSEIFCLEPL